MLVPTINPAVRFLADETEYKTYKPMAHTINYFKLLKIKVILAVFLVKYNP